MAGLPGLGSPAFFISNETDNLAEWFQEVGIIEALITILET
jgi:hypothetical protein